MRQAEKSERNRKIPRARENLFEKTPFEVDFFFVDFGRNPDFSGVPKSKISYKKPDFSSN